MTIKPSPLNATTMQRKTVEELVEQGQRRNAVERFPVSAAFLRARAAALHLSRRSPALSGPQNLTPRKMLDATSPKTRALFDRDHRRVGNGHGRGDASVFSIATCRRHGLPVNGHN